jgi:hypothetical protein
LRGLDVEVTIEDGGNAEVMRRETKQLVDVRRREIKSSGVGLLFIPSRETSVSRRRRLDG